MKTFFENVLAALRGDESVVLASVAKRTGSAPRDVDAWMMVHADGRVTGTIGGGSMEAMAIEEGGRLLAAGASQIKKYALSAAEAAGTGMICGGEVLVCFVHLAAGDTQNIELMERVVACQRGVERAWLVARVTDAGEGRLFVCAEGEGAVTAFPDEGAAVPAMQELCGSPQGTSIRRGDATYTVELIPGVDRAFVFGGGHISKALVPILGSVGFRVTVVDDRSAFANPERFPTADECLVGFGEELFAGLGFCAQSYVVIVTRGHLSDKEVLQYTLKYGKDAAYIGMIGSRAKREATYAALEAEGVSRDLLAGVHSPIGLPIGARTPEEIAVCIAAEMIQVRAGRST